MTQRLPVHALDPAAGVDGDGIVIAGGKFTIGPVGGGGGGTALAVLDQSANDTAITTVTGDTTLWSRTITAAPAGTYLVTVNAFVNSGGTGFGHLQLYKSGVAVGPKTDPGRSSAAHAVTLTALVTHTSGDLVLTLKHTSDSGTFVYGAGTDPRFGRHVQIVGPLATGNASAAAGDIDGGAPDSTYLDFIDGGTP